jgi:hypothetical protein
MAWHGKVCGFRKGGSMLAVAGGLVVGVLFLGALIRAPEAIVPVTVLGALLWGAAVFLGG